MNTFFQSASTLLSVGFALVVSLVSPTGYGADTEVKTEPAEAGLARFASTEAVSSVGWYFLSDSPRRERQLAQTILIPQDGMARHFALQMAGESLVGMGAEGTYELKVYESPRRPEKSFISRNVVLTQDGTVREGSGGWLVFPLNEELALKASHYYTFAISFTAASQRNKVVFSHSQGDPDGSFRWHRSGRDSWVVSSMSLHYVLY